MFDILFGWRKASKCKKLIKQVHCRLKLLKNKRSTIIRQLREDMAELIKNGHENVAFNRVEQLVADENIVQVYELLGHFCEFILLHLSYIRRHKDCPNDVNEAVSSLIFASARCGELPELRVIRKLFEERYGQRFAMVAVELLPGNLVNRQVKEKLSPKLVSDDMKQRLVNEIASDYCLRPEILALEYYSDWQQQLQAKENGGDHTPNTNVGTYYDRAERSATKATNFEIERKIIFVDSSPVLTNFGDSKMISTPAISSSMVQQALPTVSESSVHNEEQGAENYAELDSQNVYSLCKNNQEERMIAASSSESLAQFPEETVVYLDDIEEFQSPTKKDENSQDQRLFKFKSSILTKRENCESSSEKSSSRSSKRGGNGSGKRPRRRSVSRENQSMKDIECISYYSQPPWKSSTAALKHKSQKQRKQQKRFSTEESEQQYYEPRKPKQPCFMEMRNAFVSPHRGFNLIGSSNCSLERPCYICAGDENTDYEVPSGRQKKMNTTVMEFPTHNHDKKSICSSHCKNRSFWNAKLNKGTKWSEEPRRRSYDNGAMMYDVFTYPDHQPNIQMKNLNGKTDEFGSQESPLSSPCPKVNTSWTRKDTVPPDTVPPYLRTVTMPPERPKNKHRDDMQRSSSCVFRNPNHVHPKLPDYDDIAARFMALKKENTQNKHPNCNRAATLAQ
ncbi:hypothetical protein FEM48_Zijuj04G0071900 [Ziziphus jujuba var. spinosa]|uniref:IST1-like protein n=1 Tax=Ziziphus jujuba var. spinosa TaxID=714518 RepID=A0A978VII5_ZIZJJ|nr:hypothetical protein FEM48_Zijuj04G0071900 [Ziziphus jujuba var. spinosa]